jgi:hypothetical protein
VLKLDVEGLEHLVVSGGKRTILQGGIPYIAMEFQPSLLAERSGIEPITLLKVFTEAGYRLSLSGFDQVDSTPEEIVELVRSSMSYPVKFPGYVDIFLTYSRGT